VPDIAHTVTDNRHSGDYRRGLSDILTGKGETNNWAEYIRVERDTGDVIGEVRRMLHVFIRLLTGGAVRDYIIRRFLKSNEEMVVKSAVCREITIESRIH
jgi:TnpA family transposase